MKKLLFLSMLSGVFAFGQTSKIYPKNKIVLGEDNTFVYEPVKGNEIPSGTYANIVNMSGIRKAPLKKVNNLYEFTVKVPDSIRTLVMVFRNQDGNFSDNNSNKGFSYYLNKTKNGKAEADRLMFLTSAEGYFNFGYDTKKLISEFDTLFKTYPKIKEDSFTYYLYLMNQGKINPETAKTLAEQRTKMLETKGDEKSLEEARNIYGSILQNTDKADEISKMLVEKYPTGEAAKGAFVRSFYEKINNPDVKFDEKMMAQFEDDLQKFPKHRYDVQWTDNLKQKLLKQAIEERDWNKIDRIAASMSDDWYAASEFNQSSWKIADGDHMDSTGKDLDFAQKLAEKSLSIYDEKVKNIGKYEQKEDYDQTWMFYTDALAMILYKQKKYQQAFNEQSKLINFDFIDDGNRERYVMYAEKAKGTDFVKNYISTLLKDRNISDNLFNKLTDIYKSQNLSTIDIEKLRADNKKIATKKAKQQLLQYYKGDLTAKDFSLVDMQGKNVKLSDYKGKIVVLDFWATWCGPCRESLPHMQEIVNKYKGQEVEFFFINTMENDKPEKIRTDVSKFMAENKYQLNVLYDFKDEVANKYKVQGIPTEIIIDKEGNIISRSVGYDGNLEALIRENL